ncbi:glycosyltransferase family 4 protein [Acidimicrobiaceae bacterium]|nr:glycosyltransferase family 4 protein [Acidimicrobiaceae bacterium]
MSTNLLLVSPYNVNFYGGVQNQVNLFKNNLDSSKFNVRILAPDSSDYDIGKSFRIPFNGSNNPISLLPNKLILNEAIAWADIIHIHEPFIPLFFWRLKSSKKIIVTHHAKISKSIYFGLKFLYLTLNSKNFYSTAVSDEAKENALTLSKKTRIIPNFIVIDENISFIPNNNFLFIGRNESRKNLKLFIDLSKTIEETKDFIAITNKSSEKDSIKYELNISDDEKNLIIKNVGFYIAPQTHSESFGITILEAINAGNIAICSNLPAFMDLLGDSGIYFKNDNLQSLLNVLNKINNSDLHTIWNKQYDHINNNYNSKKVLDDWIYVYNNL